MEDKTWSPMGDADDRARVSIQARRTAIRMGLAASIRLAASEDGLRGRSLSKRCQRHQKSDTVGITAPWSRCISRTYTYTVMMFVWRLAESLAAWLRLTLTTPGLSVSSCLLKRRRSIGLLLRRSRICLLHSLSLLNWRG